MVDDKTWQKESIRWIPKISDAQRIHVDKIRKRINLDERARSDGRIDAPSRTDKALNEPQLDICGEIFSGILLLNQQFAEQLDNALDRARRSRPESIDVNDYKARMAIEADSVFDREAGGIRQLRQADLGAQRDYRYFRNRHKLNRQAHYKDSIILVVGMIIGLIVIESAINGSLLKDVVSTGLLGGAALAFAISLINVSLGLAAGLVGWKNIGHVDVQRKMLGIGVSIVAHGTAILFNLLVAHFRDVAEIAIQSPGYDFNWAVLTEQARAHWAAQGVLGVNSLLSWALLILGIIVHFIAAREGWNDIGDRYPDFARVDRQAKLARRQFDEQLVALRAQAQGAVNAVISDAEAVAGAQRNRWNTVVAVADLAVQREKELRDSEDEWVAGGTQLLKGYRDINLEVRGDEGPAYFAIFPSAVDYRKRQHEGLGTPNDEIDIYIRATKAAIAEFERLKAEGGAVDEANTIRLRELRAEVNSLLLQLSAKVAGAKADATADAIEQINGDGQAL